MDALKVIPQIFFDIIARVTPGALAMFFALRLTQRSLESFLLGTIGASFAHSPLAVAAAFVGAAFVFGQCLSAPGKLLGDLVARDLKNEKNANAKNYDWLRAHRPDAGALCAKIRAEVTMHNALAIVFGLASIVGFVTIWHWWQSGFIAFLCAVSVVRGRETLKTFHGSVVQLRVEENAPIFVRVVEARAEKQSDAPLSLKERPIE